MSDHITLQDSDAIDWRKVPEELERYVQLDLSTSGLLIGALNARLAHEDHEARTPIPLTNDLSTEPAGLTPEMAAWYASEIAPVRSTALAAIRSRFSTDRIKDIPTILLEAERDERRHATNIEKHEVLDGFDRTSSELRAAWERAEREYDNAEEKHGGRPPVMMNPWVYWVGLIVFSLGECGLNFETFANAPWIPSPFLATFVTIFIAFGLGLASHLHGSLLKQWDYFFGPYDKVRWREGAKLLAIGTTAAAVALGVVAAARYYFLLPQIQQAELIGQAPPNMLMFVTTAMAGNVIAYLMGAWWAYRWHDPDPDYPKYKSDSEKARDIYNYAFRSGVTNELARLDARCANEIAMLEKRNDRQHASPNNENCRRLFAQMRAIDEKVLGALKEYRARLARSVPKAHYIYPDRNVVSPKRSEVITAQAWAAKDLSMKYHGGQP